MMMSIIKKATILFLVLLFVVGQEENVRLVAIIWCCWTFTTICIFYTTGISARNGKKWSTRRHQANSRNVMRKNLIGNSTVMTLLMFALIFRSVID